MMAKNTASTPSPEVLPYLRTALGKLGQYLKKENYSFHFGGNDETAEYLLDQLVQHGLPIVSAMPAALAVAAADPVALRHIHYTQAEGNKLLKTALGTVWPEVKFFVWADKYGSTEVCYRYWYDGRSLAEVKEIAEQFCGEMGNGFDKRDFICHNCMGAYGVTEKVSYDTGMLVVNEVRVSRPESFRMDKLPPSHTIFPLHLQPALRKA